VDFLRNSANKKKLFALLTSKVEEFIWLSDKHVYVTTDIRTSSVLIWLEQPDEQLQS